MEFSEICPQEDSSDDDEPYRFSTEDYLQFSKEAKFAERDTINYLMSQGLNFLFQLTKHDSQLSFGQERPS
jgi:hypothetical protein